MRDPGRCLAFVCIGVVLGLTGCQSQADDATSREQARQARRMTPLSVAGRAVAVHAEALDRGA